MTPSQNPDHGASLFAPAFNNFPASTTPAGARQSPVQVTGPAAPVVLAAVGR